MTPDSDTILDEIHAVRRKIADRAGGDLQKMVAAARKRQKLSGRPIWKPPAPVETVKQPAS